VQNLGSEVGEGSHPEVVRVAGVESKQYLISQL